MTAKDRWREPYVYGITTKRFSYRKTGVYFIRDKETKELLYVGMSKSCVYKALYRHFQVWNDPFCCRIVYDREACEVRVFLISFDRVDYTERRLIRGLKPKDNRERYENFDEEEEFPDYDNVFSVGSQVGEVECPF